MGQPSVLVLTGPSGVGKTTVAHEVSRQLGTASVPHAIIDTDQLDMVHPRPPVEVLRDLSRRNLAAIWQSFAALGQERLILSLVMASPAANLPWLRVAIPGARFTIVRLRASQATRRERLTQREIGSGLDEHLIATERAARRIEEAGDGFAVIETDGRPVIEIAREAIVLAGWRGG